MTRYPPSAKKGLPSGRKRWGSGFDSAPLKVVDLAEARVVFQTAVQAGLLVGLPRWEGHLAVVADEPVWVVLAFQQEVGQ